MSSIRQAPGTDKSACDCTCPGSCAAPTITGTVLGCGGGAAAGVTVTAHDATGGGTVLDVDTTDASGNYSLTCTGAISGNNIVVVPSLGSRFNSTSSTLAYTADWTCGATSSGVNFSLSAAAGYHCLTGCAIPLKDTLNFTHTLFGSGTVTWVAADQWNGPLSYNYPGCAPSGCTAEPALIMSVTFTGGAPGIGWPTFLGCPMNSLPGFYTDPPSSSSLTCFPLNAVSNYAAGRGPAEMYCPTGSADTLTVTE